MVSKLGFEDQKILQVRIEGKVDAELRNRAKRRCDLSKIVNEALQFFFLHTNPQKEIAAQNAADSSA